MKDICHTRLLYKLPFKKLAPGRRLEGVEVGGEIKVSVSSNAIQRLEGFLQHCQVYISTHYPFNLICLKSKVQKNLMLADFTG